MQGIRDSAEYFALVGLTARLEFSTDSSITFALGTMSDHIHFPDDNITVELDQQAVFNACGWVTVHHPCQGHLKARVHAAVPDECLTTERIQKLVLELFALLDIPSDETYEVLCFKATEQVSMVKCIDREGKTDRWSSYE